jgi:Ran GTPase-activating protein (RanGAP) involved in mRNA processing and transport
MTTTTHESSWNMHAAKIFLLRNCNGIESMSFIANESNLSPIWTSYDSMLFVQSIENHPTLREITLVGTIINIDRSNIFRVFGTLPNLLRLHIPFNNLIDTDLRLLLSSIDIKKLTDIDLSGNSFGYDTVSVLVNRLNEGNNIRKLCLSKLRLRDTDIIKITTELLHEKSNLCTLDYSNNMITNVGLEFLCQAFNKSRSLQHIDLQQNMFVPNLSLQSIVRLLKKNTTIETFNVYNSHWNSKQTYSKIQHQLSLNKQTREHYRRIISLSINDNTVHLPIHKTLWAQAISSLKHHEDLYDVLKLQLANEIL